MWTLKYRVPWLKWLWSRKSQHASLSGAKRAACKLHKEQPQRRFEVYDPDGKLCLKSTPNMSWRLRWRKAA